MREIKLVLDSKSKVDYFVNKGAMSKEIIQSLWKANNYVQIVEAFKKELAITEINTSKFWVYIIQTIWINHDDFGGKEIIILKEIINNNGVILLKKIRMNLKELTNYSIVSALDTLHSKKIIEVLKVAGKDRDRLIIIHPELKKSVYKERQEKNAT